MNDFLFIQCTISLGKINLLLLEFLRIHALDNEVTRRLRNEEAYMMWVQRRVEIQLQHPFIKGMMDGDAGVFPTVQDYQAWLEVQKTLDETIRMERMALYWQGHVDCYAYLKKIGAL